jgi:hypothetical protein
MVLDLSRVKFRASSVGSLLVGGNAITDKQLARLQELQDRKDSPTGKPLTPNMENELADLIEKRDADYEFGATAKSCIRDLWLRNEYGYDEPLVTNELLKGLLCEDEAIALVSKHVPGGFRVKNDEQFEDAWFTGCPDIIAGDWVEDTKISWSLRTFFDVSRPDPMYYAQGQVYMALTNKDRFRLVHVVVETPFEIVEEELKRFFFRFNCDESSPHYQEAVSKVNAMHGAVAKVPENQRIKTYEFYRNEPYLETLRLRVEQARELYAKLSFGGFDE